MQKTILSFWLCLSLAMIHRAHAQQNVGEPAFGLKGGLNISSISSSGGQINSAAVGFHAGAYITTMLSDKIGIQPELVYSQQGYRISSANFYNGTGGYNVHYNYLYLPVIVKIYVSDGANIQLGPQFGYLLSSNETIFTPSTPRKLDAGVALGIGYETDGGLNFTLRYNRGFINVAPSTYAIGQSQASTNQVFQLSVGYTFGQ
ncbi:MAG: porin family protein [Bacteroidota bacterium]